MRISFFEEFPTDENLKKVDMISFDTKLYIAATSAEEFKKIKKKINSEKVKDVVYWPVMSYSDGYWMSPFAKRKALLKVMEDCMGMDILWDCELPRRRSLIFTNLCQFIRNKYFIRTLFLKHQGQIYSAEYFPEKGLIAKWMAFLGLTYSPDKYKNKVIKMVYSSMHDHGDKFIIKEVTTGVKMYGDNFLVALGTIATGIRGDEPVLDVKKLERDLRICKEADVSEVVIFRLAGLNEEYAEAIRKYA